MKGHHVTFGDCLILSHQSDLFSTNRQSFSSQDCIILHTNAVEHYIWSYLFYYNVQQNKLLLLLQGTKVFYMDSFLPLVKDLHIHLHIHNLLISSLPWNSIYCPAEVAWACTTMLLVLSAAHLTLNFFIGAMTPLLSCPRLPLDSHNQLDRLMTPTTSKCHWRFSFYLHLFQAGWCSTV